MSCGLHRPCRASPLEAIRRQLQAMLVQVGWNCLR